MSLLTTVTNNYTALAANEVDQAGDILMTQLNDTAATQFIIDAGTMERQHLVHGTNVFGVHNDRMKLIDHYNKLIKKDIRNNTTYIINQHYLDITNEANAIQQQSNDEVSSALIYALVIVMLIAAMFFMPISILVKLGVSFTLIIASIIILNKSNPSKETKQ